MDKMSTLPDSTHNAFAEMLRLKDLYLFSYNICQSLGWAFSFFRIVRGCVATYSINGAYSSAGELICLLQTLAFLEVIHGAIGFVPSGVVLPLMQWGGRTHFLLAILRRVVEVQHIPSVFITFVAWSLSEIIRYTHYALNFSGSAPNWITFIRYNAFIVLYPIGIFPGEMWLMYQALPFIKKEKLYAESLPFSYHNFVVLLLFCYPFLWLKLYLHLFKQRRSKLGKRQKQI